MYIYYNFLYVYVYWKSVTMVSAQNKGSKITKIKITNLQKKNLKYINLLIGICLYINAY